MLVKNNKKGLAGVNAGVTVPVKMLVLKVGWNEVPLTDWLEARKTIPGDDLGEAGSGKTFEEILKKEKIEGTEDYQYDEIPLNKLNATKAVSIVEGCWNKESLSAWYKIENRDDVRTKLGIQIEKLKKPNPSEE